MKYTKPQDHNYRLQGEYSDALEQFARSLPAEFEIVESGMTQVRWPEGLTRERLEALALQASWCSDPEPMRSLNALAAIAPVNKKRKVALYEFLGHGDGSVQYGTIIGFTHDGPMPGGFPWRKVGECEVDA